MNTEARIKTMCTELENQLEILWRLLDTQPDNTAIHEIAHRVNDAHSTLIVGGAFSTDEYVSILRQCVALYSTFGIGD